MPANNNQNQRVPDDPVVPVSFCASCCKSPVLKNYVLKNRAGRAECDYCGKNLVTVNDRAGGIFLNNLVRALIRYHYYEHEYNHHFGGDSLSLMLCAENPIFDHSRISDPETTDSNFERLLWPAYPSNGISYHAGYGPDGDQNMLLMKISGERSPELDSVQIDLRRRNHFEVEPRLHQMLTELGDKIDVVVPRNSDWYRCRLGVNSRYLLDAGGFEGTVTEMPHSGAAIGAPPPLLATPGRLNRDAVSFLYLASDIETAVAEIRPHPGNKISVGKFVAPAEIRVADFSKLDITDFSQADKKLDAFHFAISLNRVLSEPVPPDQRHRYSVTHLLADVLRKMGYQGVKFSSSVGSGNNLCIFQSNLLDNDGTFGKVVKVTALRYETHDSEYTLTVPEGAYKIR